MQSIFRLPWCSDQLAVKKSDQMSFDPLRPSSVVDIPGLAKLKRKRNLSPEPVPLTWSVPKKARTDQSRLPPVHVRELGPVQTPTQTPTPVPAAPEARPPTMGDPVANVEITTHAPMVAPTDDAAMDVKSAVTRDPLADDLSPLQQVIDNEFNMQILMKHNELRLIEQELAKCQVALEQLRRCEIRPFPGADGLSADLTAGTGPAVAPSPGYTRPSHPAPYGVTDGPYSRHYRQWLLADTRFDSIPVSAALHMEQAGNPYARSTRNSGSMRKSLSKSFSTPAAGRLSETSSSLPNYPSPAPRDKSAPLVLRRSTDGQLVKLICNNCLRGNFSSIQGFLNHCRIAHKVDYKSHDAAAIDCGRALEEHEAANLPPETANTPTAKPAPASKPQPVVAASAKHLVHPMNASSGAVQSAVIPLQATPAPRKAVRSNATPVAPAGMGSGSAFTPSTQASHLSAHFAKFKLGGNLQEAIASAKEKIDLSGNDEELYSPDTGFASPTKALPGSRMPEGKNLLGRPVSQKGHREPLQRPRPSPLMPVPRQDSSELGSPMDQTPHLSPHAAESDPGLVSDHEEDDHASGSEDETPRSAGLSHAFPVRGDCSDEMDLDVAVDDGIDEHGVVIRRHGMFATEETALGAAAGSPSRPHIVSKQQK